MRTFSAKPATLTRRIMSGVGSGETRVGLPWQSLGAFVRISTNPRAFTDPLTPADAWIQIEEWLDAP